MSIQDVTLFLVVIGLMFLGIRSLNSLILIRKVFPKGKTRSSIEGLQGVNEILEIVNRESATFTFIARRTSVLLFRGKKLTLIDGSAGYPQIAGRVFFWKNDKCIYIISTLGETGWIRCQSDVFSPAFSGKYYSVFWVDLRRLMKNGGEHANTRHN